MKQLILTHKHRLGLLLVLCLVAATLFATQDLWAPKVNIAMNPHQALYEVRLSRLHQSNALAAAKGQMSYRVEDTCDGWNTSQKFNLVFVYTEAQSAMITSDYNTYESKDGRHYQFSTRRSRDGEVTEEILGKVERDALGNGTVIYQKPKKVSAVLDTDVLFPVQHTLSLLRAAQEGKKWFSFPVFDGSDLSPATDVNSFARRINKPYITKIEDIVPLVTPAIDEDMTASVPVDSATDDKAIHVQPRGMTVEQMNASPLISNTKAWRVRLAFFARPEGVDFKSTEAEDTTSDDVNLTPDYEMTMILHSNGLVSHFTLDYPDFSLDAHLLSIAEVTGNSC
jgi:hypothetical protein